MSPENLRLLERFHRIRDSYRGTPITKSPKIKKESICQIATKYLAQLRAKFKITKTPQVHSLNPKDISELFDGYKTISIESLATNFQETNQNLSDILENQNEAILAATAQDSIYDDRIQRRVDLTTYNQDNHTLTLYRILANKFNQPSAPQ
mgnify:CR=1 FL=1|jgi:hypothetical protein